MNKDIKKNIVKTDFINILYVILGSALLGLSLSTFAVPNNIAPGGVSGLSTALAHITPIRVSIWALILNVPIIIWSFRSLGLHSTIMSLLSALLLSFFIDFLGAIIPHYTGNKLLAAIATGIISGTGIGLLFLRGISTGGTDLLTLILHRYLPNIPSGNLLMIIDGTVVIIATLIFKDIEVALCSIITIFICSKVIDMLSQGVEYAKVIYTITENGESVSKALNEKIDRGATIIPAQGSYTGKEKELIITVTKRNMLSQTLKVIKQADPTAFTFVSDSTEVHGEGFKLD